MADPFWLPSTFMQTIAALFGIFIAIFILAIQSIANHKKEIETGREENEDFNHRYNQTMDTFVKTFFVIACLVFIIEVADALVILFITDKIFEDFYIAEVCIYTGFVVILMAILLHTYYMISFSISLERKDPKFFYIKEFNFINKFNFYRVITFIAVNSICIAIYFYLVNRIAEPVMSSILFCLLTGSVMWFLFQKKILRGAALLGTNCLFVSFFYYGITLTNNSKSDQILQINWNPFKVCIIPALLLLIIIFDGLVENILTQMKK